MKSTLHFPFRAALALFAVTGLSTIAMAEDGWLVDFAKAKARSVKEGKPILMEFTGSDWCPPCKALHKNVLTSDVFKKQMPGKFILLKLDNRRDKTGQTPEEIAQYKKLSSEYEVRGVPTIVIADAKGKEQHRQVGYRSSVTAEQWVNKLMAAVKPDTPVTTKASAKHPAHIAHAWKSDPFMSKGLKQSITFGSTGELTITPDKGKAIKGKWEVEGNKMTLVYPDPLSGKKQTLKYGITLGGGEEQDDTGKIKETVDMYLKREGETKTSVVYVRPVDSKSASAKPAPTPKPAKPAKVDKVHKTLPGIDLTKYSAKQRVTILARANKERCPCGCKLTVAGCRHDDRTCGTGKKLAAKIVEEVTGQAPVEPKAKDIGKPVDIQFIATDGTKVDLTKMKGKVVLIDFWATWCGPCIREIPNIKKTYAKLHPKGFEIVGISLDSNKEKLLNFIKEKEMPWVQYFDGQGWKNKISSKYGIRSIPAMWLIDKKGNLVDKNARSGLEDKVEKLLAAKVSTKTVDEGPAPNPIDGILKPKVVPSKLIANLIIVAAIRENLGKPSGEFNKADLEKVTRLYLDSNQLTSVKGLEKLNQLTWLRLKGKQLTDVTGLEKLPRLRELDLSSSRLTNAPKGLEKLTQLKRLNLGANKLTDIKGLENLTKLESLGLSQTQLTKLPEGLEKLTKLKVLYLRYNPALTRDRIDELQKALPKCKIYHNAGVVADNKPKYKAPVAAVDDLPATVRQSDSAKKPIAVKQKPLTEEESAKVIEAAIRKAAKKPTGDLTKADLEKVTLLDLIEYELTDVKGQLTDVKGVEKLTQLKDLYLSENQLTKVPKGLEKLSRLTTLSLYENQLTDVKGLEKLTQLRVLDLSSNQLTDVRGLEKLTQLRVLDLHGNQLTDVKGLEKLTQLRKLNLNGNKLTDVKGLGKLRQLEVLWLTVNPDLTKAQIDELKKALPKCLIDHNAGVVADNKPKYKAPVAAVDDLPIRPSAAAADDLPAKIKALLDRYKEMRAEDPDKAGAQAIKDSGKLARENPEEVRPWSLYLSAARFAKDPKEKKAIFQEVAAAKSPKLASVVAKAKGELTKLDALGKPVDIEFVSTDGRKVDLAKMKGKVVLIDFWATWCGPCVRELPNVKKAYAKLHPKGFEIVGISLDSDEGRLEKFVKDKEMPWPQYFDGLKWQNKISTKFGVRSIPAMWLIDKKGNLVDMNARSGLEEKVEKLLAQ